MQIKWTNVFAILFIVFAIYLFFKAKPVIDRLFENFESMPLRQDPGTFAIILLGMILITVVAVVKIISNRKE
jgi:hypothetical protein